MSLLDSRGDTCTHRDALTHARPSINQCPHSILAHCAQHEQFCARMRVIKRSNRPTARGCVLASQPTAPAHHPSRLTIRVGAPSESAHCPSAPFGPFDSQIYLLPGAAPRAQPRATRASESNTSTVENRPGLSRIPNLFAPGRREQIYLSNLLAKPRAESNTGDRRPPGPIAGIQHEVLARAPRP